MSRFLKLSNFVLNKSFIHEIQYKEKQIILRVCIPEFTGFQLFSCGTISSTSYTYTFCPEKTQADFKIISKWIDSMD